VVKNEAPALLKALRAAHKDKSPIVRSSYATAAAGLAPLTTHASLKHYVLHLKVRSRHPPPATRCSQWWW
jgi:hypothetical protein